MTTNVPFQCKQVTFEPRSGGKFAVRVNGVLQKELVKKSQVATTRMSLGHEGKPIAKSKILIWTNVPTAIGVFVPNRLFHKDYTKCYCPHCNYDHQEEGKFTGKARCWNCKKRFRIELN